MDRQVEGPRVTSPTNINAERGLALFFLGVGSFIVAEAVTAQGTLAGVKMGFGVASVAVGLLLGWTWRFTVRHLAEPASFWKQVQDKWRPLVLLWCGGGGAAVGTAGALCYAAGMRTVGAGVAAFGVVFLAIAASMIAGLIRPVRYEQK